MRHYPALRTIASVIKVVTVIACISSFYFSCSMAAEGGPGLATAALSVLGTAIAALFSWALAEIILVFVNMGEDISKMLGGQEGSIAQTDTAAATPSPTSEPVSTTEDIAPGVKICPNCAHCSAAASGSLVCKKWGTPVTANNTCTWFMKADHKAGR